MVALWFELPGLNGPSYWRWPWRTLDLVDTAALFAPPLGLLGILAWVWSRSSPPTAAGARALTRALALCQLLLQWAHLRAEPGGWAWLVALVQSPEITSYYTDALKIDDLGVFLRDFAAQPLEHHTSTHPVGPVIYYWAFVKLCGPEAGARWAGAVVAVISSAGVAVAYGFAALWTPDPFRRLGACFLYALMPALVAVQPSLDAVYPLFTMLALMFWHASWERPPAAVALGLCMFVATLMAYQTLLLALPLALYALGRLKLRGWDAELRRSMLRALGLAFGVWIAAYGLVYALTPYRPLESFAASLARQAGYAALLERPYWTSLIYDPYDFFLGAGFLTLPLVLRHAAREDREGLITAAGLVAILLIDLSGLIRCEAARVWLFLQPLAVVPAGLAFARFAPRARAAILSLQALILIAIICKLIFLYVP